MHQSKGVQQIHFSEPQLLLAPALPHLISSWKSHWPPNDGTLLLPYKRLQISISFRTHTESVLLTEVHVKESSILISAVNSTSFCTYCQCSALRRVDVLGYHHVLSLHKFGWLPNFGRLTDLMLKSMKIPLSWQFILEMIGFYCNPRSPPFPTKNLFTLR